MTDTNARLMRYRVVEELDVLASGADAQIAHLSDFGGWYEELALEYLD